MKGYKAFRIDKQGNVRFLFHTHKHSSLVRFNSWLKTKQHWVTDGSRQKKYRSGFHFFPTNMSAERFDALTKNKYLILPVIAYKVRPKPHSSAGSWLAEKIFIPCPL